MTSQSAPPEPTKAQWAEHRGGLVEGGRNNTRHRQHCFNAGYALGLAAAYEDAIPVIRHGKDCPNGLQDWMDERVDERGDCSASDCPTVMVVIRERAGIR